MRRAKPFIPPKVTVAAVTVGNGYDALDIVGSLDPYTPLFAPAGHYDVRNQLRARAPAVADLVSP
jgi:hypothetical protein